jgi:hypothetical protein
MFFDYYELKRKLFKPIFHIFMQMTNPVELSIATNKNDTGIVTITCHDHVFFLIICIKSFLFFTKLKLPVFVVDDGSLLDGDIRVLKKHLINIEIIRSKKAEKFIRKKLKGYKYSLKWRNSPHPFTHYKKFFDPFLLSNFRRIIFIDADIIFFAVPHEILNWIMKNKRSVLYMTDHRSKIEDEMGLLAFKVLSKFLNYDIAPTFNSGIVCLNREDYDLSAIEKFIPIIYEYAVEDTWFAEALLFATLCYNIEEKKRGVSKVLPPLKYSVLTSPFIRKNVWERICIHYLADKKKYFYADAIKLLIKSRLFTVNV